MSSQYVDDLKQMQKAGLGAQKRCLGSEATSGHSKRRERGWTACLWMRSLATETPPFGRQGERRDPGGEAIQFESESGNLDQEESGERGGGSRV